LREGLGAEVGDAGDGVPGADEVVVIDDELAELLVDAVAGGEVDAAATSGRPLHAVRVRMGCGASSLTRRGGEGGGEGAV